MCETELSKMDIHLMEDITKKLNDNSFESYFEYDTIFVCYGIGAHINIYENNVIISFNINTDQYDTAMIMKLVMETTSKYKLYTVEIDEPYLEIFDNQYNYLDILYGLEEIEEYKSSIYETIQSN